MDDLRKMSDERLVAHIANWQQGTWHRVLAKQELKRRRGKPKAPQSSWIAIGITAAALLLVSVTSF